eukprot:137129_1
MSHSSLYLTTRVDCILLLFILSTITIVIYIFYTDYYYNSLIVLRPRKYDKVDHCELSKILQYYNNNNTYFYHKYKLLNDITTLQNSFGLSGTSLSIIDLKNAMHLDGFGSQIHQILFHFKNSFIRNRISITKNSFDYIP